MKKRGLIFYKLLVLSILCMSFFGLYAQNNPNVSDTSGMPMGEKSAKNYVPVYAYNFNPSFPEIATYTLIDTSIYGIQRSETLASSQNLYAHAGVVGQANIPMNYQFNRKHGFAYKTMPYNEYHRRFDSWKWYHTPESYTRIDYEWASGKENLFNVVHAQSVKDMELGIDFRTIIAEGIYIRQAVRDVNAGARFSYHIPSNRYGFTFAYIYNLFRLQENGGISNDTSFENGQEERSIAVNLLDANSDYQDHDVFFRQYLSLYRSTSDTSKKDRSFGYLLHDLNFTRLKSLYKDNNVDINRYSVVNYDSTSTFDSITSYQFKNSLMWSNALYTDSFQQRKHFLYMTFGLSHAYSKVGDSSHIFYDHQFTPFAYVQLRLFRKLNIKTEVLYTINGYNANDISAKASIAWNFKQDSTHVHVLAFQVAGYRYEADYFYSYYFANTYNWDIPNLRKQQHFNLGLEWKYNPYTLSLYYFTLKNAVILAQDMHPMQLSKSANILQLAAWIPFRYKGFGFDMNAYLQYSDNAYIQLPYLASRESIFYGFGMFKKAMFLQFGFELMYNTPYYAKAYNPVMQQFYFQNDKKIGNYYYLDFFANVKISRFYFHVVLGNFMADVFPKTYYFIPHYPAKGLHVKFGASWRFHD